MCRELVAYLRVSTRRQGRSGLGEGAQRAKIQEHAAKDDKTVVAEFIEVETGKRNDRPKLQEALAECRLRKAALIVAKLDRLARDAHFLLSVQKSGVDLIFCDFPLLPTGPAGKAMITFMATIAEMEAGLIADRTKGSLAAYRKSGRVSRRIVEKYDGNVPADVVAARAGKLGAELPECRNLDDQARERGAQAGGDAAREAADAHAADIRQKILTLRAAEPGISCRQIAMRLNDQGLKTRHDKPWNPTQVARVMDRLGLERVTREQR